MGRVGTMGSPDWFPSTQEGPSPGRCAPRRRSAIEEVWSTGSAGPARRERTLRGEGAAAVPSGTAEAVMTWYLPTRRW